MRAMLADVRSPAGEAASATALAAGTSQNAAASLPAVSAAVAPPAELGSSAVPRINLLGSGDVRQLGVPPQLYRHVALYKDLGYADYYDTLCRCVGMGKALVCVCVLA